ncbi:hypothetical protein BC834DRAFT_665184 [Gloeopeniophorella convolvens]|nr:hypothetical protein BC834DRAFT_665184 [Gloeopeniophorella convolvens]
MPAKRTSTLARPRSRAPYVAPPASEIIVISSEDEDEPKPPPRRRSRKPARAARDPAVELSEDTSGLKSDGLDSETAHDVARRLRDVEKERDRLQKDFARVTNALDQLKATNKESLSAIDEAVCCEVCTHYMWSPYLLVNCGHTFCQECLSDWLSTTLAQHLQAGVRGLPAYTCPSCRHPVRAPPAQNYALKRVVRLVAESQGESRPRRAQPPPPKPPARGRGNHPPPGPFDNFFART